MANYRVTIGFQNFIFGASETYITPNVSNVNAVPRLQSFLDKRAAILPSTTNIVGVRVAVFDPAAPVNNNRRKSKSYPYGQFDIFNTGTLVNIPGKGTFNAAVTANAPDQFRSSLQYRITYNDDRSSTRYLSGVPDAMVVAEPLSFDSSANAAWYAAFDAFRKELVDYSWAIRGRSRGAGFEVKEIKGWTQMEAAPEYLGVILDAAPSPGIVRGDWVTINGVTRKGTDKLSYNGKYKVHSVNTTLVPDSVVVWLDGTTIGDPYSIKHWGTIQKLGYQGYPIQKIEIIRAGIRKRGRPFASTAGRRSMKESLDP